MSGHGDRARAVPVVSTGQQPVPRAMTTLAAWVMLLACLPAVDAQWALGTAKFDEVFKANIAEQQEGTLSSPWVVEELNPTKFMLDTDSYAFEPFASKDPDYRMNVMINPCEGHEFNCCYDIYGTPEYSFSVTNVRDSEFGKNVQLYTDGSRIDIEASRLPDNQVVINDECVGLIDPFFDCIGFRSFRAPFTEFPVCWDRNATVNGLAGCRDPTDGSALQYCMEIAFTQNSLIVECGNEYADDVHCGTFLEIHKPEDPIILSEIRLRGQFMSGYRQTVMSLTIMGRNDMVLCRGEHQIWFVQRTRYNFVIEFKKNFFIETPDCDWDETNDRAFVYTRLDGVNARLALQGTETEVDVATYPTNEGNELLPDPTGGILYLEEQYDQFSTNGKANPPDEWA